jgi:hypothetical protein
MGLSVPEFAFWGDIDLLAAGNQNALDRVLACYNVPGVRGRLTMLQSERTVVFPGCQSPSARTEN